LYVPLGFSEVFVEGPPIIKFHEFHKEVRKDPSILPLLIPVSGTGATPVVVAMA
jgi:hypothetical protein